MHLNIKNKLNITLCGMMGAGKSAIGKILANKLDYNFIDVDKMIESDAGKTIKKIFEEDGEQYFRDLEEKITINILELKETIVFLCFKIFIVIVSSKSLKYSSPSSSNIFFFVFPASISIILSTSIKLYSNLFANILPIADFPEPIIPHKEILSLLLMLISIED